MKGIKRMLFGEKMPDKNDPQYKERYQREVKAGRKFAQTLKIDKAAAHVQRFLVIVFGFVALSFGFNIYRMARVYNHKQSSISAIERQDSLIRSRHKGESRNIHPINKQK